MEQYMFQLELKGEGVCRSRNSIRAYRYTSTCIFTNHIYHSYPDMIFNQFKSNMYITLSSVLGNLSSSSLYQLSKMFETFFISNIKLNLIFWQKKGLQTELPTPSLDLPIIMYMYQYQANLSSPMYITPWDMLYKLSSKLYSIIIFRLAHQALNSTCIHINHDLI